MSTRAVHRRTTESSSMLSLAPVLALLIAQTPAAQAGTTSWPAEFSAAGSVGHFSQGSFYNGWQGSAGGSATWFVRRPLVDDSNQHSPLPRAQRPLPLFPPIPAREKPARRSRDPVSPPCPSRPRRHSGATRTSSLR